MIVLVIVYPAILPSQQVQYQLILLVCIFFKIFLRGNQYIMPAFTIAHGISCQNVEQRHMKGKNHIAYLCTKIHSMSYYHANNGNRLCNIYSFYSFCFFYRHCYNSPFLPLFFLPIVHRYYGLLRLLIPLPKKFFMRAYILSYILVVI